VSLWVLFSDLDGTLLDESTYSFEPARAALEERRRRGFPVVLCTSKTAGETLRHQREMGLVGPFVVEAGGGIYTPKGYFAELFPSAVERGDHLLLPLGEWYGTVRSALAEIRAELGVDLRGFGDLSVEEISRDTGLSVEHATLARGREFDEPFLMADESPSAVERLRRLATDRGLRVSRGGRFYHLHGNTDKGRAVGWLKTLFRSKLGEIRTAGIGDSAIDLPMLAAVDAPYVVQKRDGTHDAAVRGGLPRVTCVPAPGPEGWSRAVRELLASP
jgi:mannosyl-3-phosphoglycerate phosphatase